MAVRLGTVTNCPNTRWLFPSKFSDGEEHITDIRNGFNAICESAGITNFRVHDLRHTLASWLVQRGVPIYEVKELLRHESISTTEKYVHLAPKDTAKHIDLINLTSRFAHWRMREKNNRF